MTPRRRILLLMAATCHLALAVTGALDMCLWETMPLGPVFTYYSALSGTNTGYGFFAPDVASPSTAEFTIVDSAGATFTDILSTRQSREADIRVENLVEVFDRRESDAAVRSQLAASWAAVMFARHPRADSVIVDMGESRVPSMAAHRRGKPTRWRSVYRARVVRSGSAEANGGR